MTRYVGLRLGAAAVTLVAVSVVVFVLLRLVSGDPVRLMFGLIPPPPEELESLRRALGLDRPLPSQHLAFVASALRGDLGRSYRTRQDVAGMIAERFPRTLRLTVLDVALAAVLGVTAGVLAGVRRGSWLDAATMAGVAWASRCPRSGWAWC